MFDRFLPCLTMLSASCALFACTAWVPPAMAGPTDDELGDLAEPLQTRVTTEFLDTPIFRVAEYIERESDLIVTIDSFTDAVPINQRFENATIRQVLDRIALTTELDWVIEEGVIFIAEDSDIRARRSTGAVFDIRGLLIQVPDYTGPYLGLDGALSNTNSGGSNASQSEGRARGGGGGGLFGDDNDTVEDVPSRQEVVEEIIELIQDTVGEPDWWLDEEWSIRELNGQLVIRATPEAIEEIEVMLNLLSATLGKMIAIEGQFYLVPRTHLDALDGRLVMTQDTYADFMEALEAEGAGLQRLAAVRTVCHNGQRVYVYAGGDRTFLSDIEPIPDTGSIDPTLSVLRNGASLDVESTITMDNRHVTMAIRSDLVTHAEMNHATAIPVTTPGGSVLPISAGGTMEGTVTPVNGNELDGEQRVRGSVNSDGVLHVPGQPGQTAHVMLDKPEQDIVNYRTNVRIPDGGALLLTGTSNMFEGIDADKFEVVLILRPRIILPDEE